MRGHACQHTTVVVAFDSAKGIHYLEKRVSLFVTCMIGRRECPLDFLICRIQQMKEK